MAAELEKLARDRKERGRTEGSGIVSSVAKVLSRAGLIPERLVGEHLKDQMDSGICLPFLVSNEPKVPRYVYERDLPSFAFALIDQRRVYLAMSMKLMPSTYPRGQGMF